MQGGQSFTAHGGNPANNGPDYGKIEIGQFTNYIDSFQSDAELAVIHKEMDGQILDEKQDDIVHQALNTKEKERNVLEEKQPKKVSEDKTPTNERVWVPLTYVQSTVEKLIQEDKQINNIEQLWDYLNANLPGFMKKNLPYYELGMPKRPPKNNKLIQFTLKNNDGTMLTCTIKEKQNRSSEDHPFTLAFSTQNQDSGKKSRSSGSRKKVRQQEDLLNDFFIPNEQLEGKDTPAKPTSQPGYAYRSFESSKKYIADDSNSNNLLVSLLVSESGSMNNIPDEKDFTAKMDKHIDNFVKEHLSPKKDWSRLKKILRAKFNSLEGITSKKVRRFLRKIGKVIKDLDEVATNIMEKKIDIIFIEEPVMSTVKELASSETSIVNWIRDIAWAPLTYHMYDMFRERAESNFITQTLTQMVISMAAMLFGALVYHLVKSRFAPKNEEEEDEEEEENQGMITFIQSLFIWLGAGLAIPGWNALQLVGVNIGLGLNLSKANAGYFSSLFPGLPEGPIQGIMSVISSNTLGKAWKKYRLRTFLKQLLIFATFGAVPGDIWQISYAIITGPIDAHGELPDWAITLILGLALATAVYIGNVSFGTAYERMINKAHLIIELEAIEDNVELKPDLIKEEEDHVVSYMGRPGAPTKHAVVLITHDHNPNTPHHSRRQTHRSQGHRSQAHRSQGHQLSPRNLSPRDNAEKTPQNSYQTPPLIHHENPLDPEC